MDRLRVNVSWKFEDYPDDWGLLENITKDEVTITSFYKSFDATTDDDKRTFKRKDVTVEIIGFVPEDTGG